MLFERWREIYTVKHTTSLVRNNWFKFRRRLDIFSFSHFYHICYFTAVLKFTDNICYIVYVLFPLLSFFVYSLHLFLSFSWAVFNYLAVRHRSINSSPLPPPRLLGTSISPTSTWIIRIIFNVSRKSLQRMTFPIR